jgi:hypothetical protein
VSNPVAEALAVAVAARVPVLLWGAPGTGKTSAIRTMAEAMGLPCETVIASIREPSDFAGLPVVTGGDSVRFAPPLWARRLASAGTGLLFLDELTTAPPAVQAALLRVVLERTVGDLSLPADVAVVAAANPPEQAADGWDLSAPLANRLCHLRWEVTPQAVADGLANGWAPPRVPRLPDGWAVTEKASRGVVAAFLRARQAVADGLANGWAPPRVPRLPDGWAVTEKASRGVVAAFLRARPALAIAPPASAADAGRGWPSPRTWEMAARLLAAADAAGAGGQARAALVLGAVGDGAGAEFLSWLVEMDLPDPEQVLADPDAFVVPERGDRAYAALAAVAAAVAAQPTPQRWAAAWRVLGRCVPGAQDVAASAAMTLARCRPAGVVELPPEIAMFAPLVRDAGLA